jgi:hypothetical protein
MEVQIMQTQSSDQTLEKLNDCLRSERSAVETYTLAIKHTDKPEVTTALDAIRESHNLRTTRIADFLRAHGVEPVMTGGAWGAVAKAVQSGANLFGDKAAVASLEEFEDRCLKMYNEPWQPQDVQEFISAELLPRQQRTHAQCRDLKRFVS